MKKLTLLVILLNSFISYSHELSGVWYISRNMPLEEELLRSETTSWGKVQTTAGAVVLDLENPEKYFSYSSMYDYYRAQIQEVKKDGDLYTLIIDNNDPPVYYKIRFLEFDKIKFLENEYLSPEYYRVTSPRSADSESDNPPLDMSNYSTTHRTLDNLRLRDAANTSSRLVTTLPKDTEIQVIETGSSTTIDGITAPWVKIISSTGYTGWCFSGYLEEVKKPELVQERIATSV